MAIYAGPGQVLCRHLWKRIPYGIWASSAIGSCSISCWQFHAAMLAPDYWRSSPRCSRLFAGGAGERLR